MLLASIENQRKVIVNQQGQKAREVGGLFVLDCRGKEIKCVKPEIKGAVPLIPKDRGMKNELQET